MLLNFHVKFTKNFIYNGYTLVRFLLVKYKVDYRTAQESEEWECSWSKTFVVTSEMLNLKIFISQRAVSKDCEKKIKIVHRGRLDQVGVAFKDAAMRDLRLLRQIVYVRGRCHL